MVLGIVPLDQTVKEMKTIRFYKDIVCEAWVTFLFMTALTQSSMNFGETPAMSTFVRSVMGLFVMALIDAYGHINYALFNPNLVVSFIITQRLSIPKGILYIVAEVLAGAGASQMVYSFTPSNISSALTPPSAVEGIAIWSSWSCELIAVFFFCSVVIAAIDEKSRPVNIPHLAVGFSVMSVTAVMGPYGVCLNPVVSFGLSMITSSWDKHWVYWTAGPIGAIIGPCSYHFFQYDVRSLCKAELEHDNAKKVEPMDNGTINKAFADENSISIISSTVNLRDLPTDNGNDNPPPKVMSKTFETGTNNNNPYKRDY